MDEHSNLGAESEESLRSLAERAAAIRAAVARGIADADAGRVVDAREGFAELERYFAITPAVGQDSRPTQQQWWLAADRNSGRFSKVVQ